MRNARISNIKLYVQSPNFNKLVLYFISVNSVHNGLYKGKRYFHCTPGHGAMVKYTEVKPLKTPSKTPPVKNNYMFPSWDEVKKRRKQRNEKLVSPKMLFVIFVIKISDYIKVLIIVVKL